MLNENTVFTTSVNDCHTNTFDQIITCYSVIAQIYVSKSLARLHYMTRITTFLKAGTHQANNRCNTLLQRIAAAATNQKYNSRNEFT